MRHRSSCRDNRVARHVIFWILIAGLLAVVVTCSDDSNTAQGGPNQPCYPDNTCQTGLVCNTMTRTCSAQQTLGVGGQGEPCFPNGSCKTGLKCEVDVCTTGQSNLPGTLGQACKPDGSCASGLTCHPTTKHCVSPPSSCPGPCGSNATCGSTNTCACNAGFADCNTDMGKVGTNGCECQGSCSGATCSGTTIECDENVLNDCGEATRYCASGQCADCGSGSFNCDGVRDCEASADCAADGCALYSPDKQCVRQDQYCDEATSRCVDCPAGMLNCSRAGKSCDCTTSCDGSFCKAECAPDVGCSNPAKWCDLPGKCVDCPAGQQNCNGSGACECQGTCSGTVCNGTVLCDYYDQNVCGGDKSQWCFQNKCYPCKDEASDGFNCNGTKGCECDSQGCDGTQCKGKCTSFECP